MIPKNLILMITKKLLRTFYGPLLNNYLSLLDLSYSVTNWYHSMARANLKKVNTSQLLLPQHYQEAQNLHQLKSPFQTQIYLVNVPINVKIVKQDLLNKKQLLKIL